jgi:hypothetical protein
MSVLWALVSTGSSQSEKPARVDFSREVLPILSENCFFCHGPDANRRKAKLRLDDEANAKLDREDGAVIVPRHSGKSLIMQRLESTDPEEVMPPPATHKKLSARQVGLIKRWIDEGAVWGKHWAFTPIRRPAIPKLKLSGAPVSHPIDAFVLQRLRDEKLGFSAPAEKTTLIRRITLDLTGLPPTLEEVEAFLRDTSVEAYEKVVDRLLASPAYGERMAWDWMEIARYADSNGYQGDSDRTMWPWRDWVVKAFNSNLPYDQFTLWQLAGDLLSDAQEDQKLATAFCRNHPINGEGGRIAEENRVDYVMDMTETTATTWLGLTFACTRCHDHKFDPLTRQDYFGLFAFFNRTPVDGGGGDPQTKPLLELLTPDQRARLTQLETNVLVAAAKLDQTELDAFPRETGKPASESSGASPLPEDVKGILKKTVHQRDQGNLETLEQHFEKTLTNYVVLARELRQALSARDTYSRQIPRVMVMADLEKPRPTFILEKGLYNKPGAEIKPGTPAILPAYTGPPPTNRLDLARWLVAPENPLPARVTVNRLWQMFFGVGLAKAAEDFGVKGEFPVHPELLDYLAAELRDSGWDVKQLVRLIVTSRTYRQSSKTTETLRQHDPDNRLLARGARFRMPSWMLRDQALAASGLLVRKLGGPPVKSYQPAGVWEETTFGKKKYKQDHGEALYRRSLYIFWRRIIGPTEFFDTPSRMTCTVKPTRNNSPLHALTTLNDTTYVEAARQLAQRIMTSANSPQQRAALAFRLVLARTPQRHEQQLLLEGWERAQTQFARDLENARNLLTVGESPADTGLDPVEHAAWTVACLIVLNLDEALTKE